MANKALEGISYPDVFSALGKFIADNNLYDVFVMEFEQGIIVTGSSAASSASGYIIETHVLSATDLRNLIAKSKQSEKRGLFGR